MPELAERAAVIALRDGRVLPENHAMIEVFRDSGLQPVVEAAQGELRVTMPAQLGVEAQAALDARDAEAATAAVGHAAQAMRRRLAAAGFETRGFVVQAMAGPGVELLAGVVADPVFGPVLACTSGGTTAELQGDPEVRLTLLGPREAGELVRSLRAFPLLDGFRGAPRCDVAALEDVLVRLAALADAHPEIVELECNPLVVDPGGAVAVDARARVRTPAPKLPEPALRPA